MRTDHPLSANAINARVRVQVARARQLLREQSPPIRLGLGLVVLALLGAVVYLSIPNNSETAFVRSGERFAPDELLKVGPELQRKHIKYQVDEGRIAVETDQLDEANDLVAKLGVGERPLDELQNPPGGNTLFVDPKERDKRERSLRNQYLAGMIRRMPDSGIVAVQVEIQRKTSRIGMQTVTHPTACVYLQTEQNRPISSQTVQKIENLIVGYEPDIKSDAVTVFDQSLRVYIDARDPKVGEETRRHAREEELVAKILKEIDYIKGVRATVQLVPAAASPPAPTAPPPDNPAPPADYVLPPPIAVNQPVEITRVAEPPRPQAAPPPPPVAAKPAAPPSEPAQVLDSTAKVWVRVPRSWYLQSTPSRNPSDEELKRVVAKTEQQIRTAVALVVPPNLASAPDIDTIFDDLPAKPTLVAPETRDTRPLWLLLGVTVGGASAMLVVGLRFAATRRPDTRRAPRTERSRFHAGETQGAGPGPSERVRELIRLNPEAAASVLHRWTGHGGTDE